MASLAKITATTGQKSYIQPLAEVIAAAFANDKFNRAVLLHLDSLPNDAAIPAERLVEHWTANIEKNIATGAEIMEAENWTAGALWFPPGVKRAFPISRDIAPGIVVEYVDKFEILKNKHLGDRKYWYLSLVGRHPDRHAKGAVRAVIDPYLKKAKEEGVPAFLAATNAHARDVYVHLGFKVVEEVTIGKGVIDKEGSIVEGGEGVILYAMVYDPEW